MRFRATGLIEIPMAGHPSWKAFYTFSPAEAGKKFANKLLDERLDWQDLSIQITGVSAKVLISSFWKSFADEMKEKDPQLFPDVQKVEWICDHQFQEDMINEHLR